MLLSEFLETAGNDTLYIGSKTNFFFIGKAEELLSDIEKYNVSWLTHFQNMFERMSTRLENLRNNPPEIKADDTQEKIDEKNKRYKFAVKAAEKAVLTAKKHVEEFVIFQDREVLSDYVKTYEDGRAVIVSGNETGGFWTLTEWQTKPHYPKVVNDI